MALPKLEGRITASSAWTATVDGDTPGTVTVAAGEYYPSGTGGLIAELLEQFQLIHSGYQVTLSDTTGKVTIANEEQSFSVTWVSTDLRDVLGFTTDLTPASDTFTGTEQAEYLFMPGLGRSGALSPEANDGRPVADTTVAISPTGFHCSIHWGERYEDTLEFRFLLASKVWDSEESTQNESLQVFWNKVL